MHSKLIDSYKLNGSHSPSCVRVYFCLQPLNSLEYRVMGLGFFFRNFGVGFRFPSMAGRPVPLA